MTFQKQKKSFLSKPDKSNIGGIDKEILFLVKKINKNQEYYTTSSCAGRIVLIKETEKKQENVFVFITHQKINEKQILKNLKNQKEMIYLKHEPCIMHIACKTLENAIKLVNIARQSGWKKSGIISIKKDKMMVELVSTEILACPISNKEKLLVSKDYLKILVKECNKKLSQTRGKIKKLGENFCMLKGFIKKK